MLDRLEVVKVGDRYYTCDEWVCAYNTVLMALLERAMSAPRTDRQLLRTVRELRSEAHAQEAVRETTRLIIDKGHPVEDVREAAVVAEFPGLSDPSGRVGVDHSAGCS